MAVMELDAIHPDEMFLEITLDLLAEHMSGHDFGEPDVREVRLPLGDTVHIRQNLIGEKKGFCRPGPGRLAGPDERSSSAALRPFMAIHDDVRTGWRRCCSGALGGRVEPSTTRDCRSRSEGSANYRFVRVSRTACSVRSDTLNSTPANSTVSSTRTSLYMATGIAAQVPPRPAVPAAVSM